MFQQAQCPPPEKGKGQHSKKIQKAQPKNTNKIAFRDLAKPPDGYHYELLSDIVKSRKPNSFKIVTMNEAIQIQTAKREFEKSNDDRRGNHDNNDEHDNYHEDDDNDNNDNDNGDNDNGDNKDDGGNDKREINDEKNNDDGNDGAKDDIIAIQSGEDNDMVEEAC